MEFNYPAANNCTFVGFPTALEIRFGPAIANIVSDGSLGEKVVLRQTESSGSPQGSYASGEGIPSFAYTYTDTGDASSYRIKIEFSGIYTFYRMLPSDDAVRFYILKNIKAYGDSGSIENVQYLNCETSVASSETDNTAIKKGEVITYDAPGPAVLERMWVYGNLYDLTEGTTFTIRRPDGVTETLTYSDYKFTVS